MTSKLVPGHVDTVIVGNGPSALILSYILHGNIPYYHPTTPHPDPILHKKLSQSPCLLDIAVDDLTAHFGASRLSYSTQVLPVNVLLDTLLRPLADTEPEKYESCIQWRFEPERSVTHIVLGNTADAGGQWAGNPVAASWDIGALSYSDMLSLPGYSFEEHYRSSLNGKAAPQFHRPTRREVAGYLAQYPTKVGINDAVYTNTSVSQIQRTDHGFYIVSPNISCKHLVLASGVFSTLIAPRPLLQPLLSLPSDTNTNGPLLVVGSGFTAADVILSTPPTRPIIHIYKWAPSTHPSPLKACHPSAYPEYGGIYRRMKLAARENLGVDAVTSPFKRRKTNPFFDDSRDWEGAYEGLPNTYIMDVKIRDEGRAVLMLDKGNGEIIEREISGMSYVIGRRGSLDYLDDELRLEVLGSEKKERAVSGHTLRDKIEAKESVEVAGDVFAIGSLTGDSLIRFAYGGCVSVAQRIMAAPTNSTLSDGTEAAMIKEIKPQTGGPIVCGVEIRAPLHEGAACGREIETETSNGATSTNAHAYTNGHINLHIDHNGPTSSKSLEHEIPGCDIWQKPGLLAGGICFS